MKLIAFIACGLLVSQPCGSRSVPAEDSVVSVYLKHPPMEDNSQNSQKSLVYLLTSGLTEKITSPFTKLFGIGQNVTTTMRPFHRIELFDDIEQVTKPDMNPINNEIPKDRDVEELSNEGAYKKGARKPEKITLFSSYLPDNEKLDVNNSINHVDIDDELPTEFDNNVDDEYDDVSQSRSGPFVFVLEVIGSFIELIFGGLMALFRPSDSS
ncbi:uncharacterized protein [Battus philenor]|uniref:uncharacterized protein n=1 Tax=Battus philenor TaxID=42288 RepID=UPI0035CFE72A